MDTAPDTISVELELHLPAAKVQLLALDLHTPIERVFDEDQTYRLDLSLTPRLAKSRFSFCERWSPRRFEPAGKVFLVPAGQPLLVRSGTGPQAALICSLNKDLMSEWFESDFEWTNQRLEASLDVTSVSVRNLLHQLDAELRHPGFASAMLCEALTMQIAVNLQRHFWRLEHQERCGGLAPWRLRMIDERLSSEARAPTLSELAQLCRLSTRQLTRAFRASKGVSIGEYVARQRLDNAKLLLSAGQSIKSVAHANGFASASSFTSAFHKATGMTPREFVRRPRSKI